MSRICRKYVHIALSRVPRGRISILRGNGILLEIHRAYRLIPSHYVAVSAQMPIHSGRVSLDHYKAKPGPNSCREATELFGKSRRVAVYTVAT
jgi:hypothetical protein